MDEWMNEKSCWFLKITNVCMKNTKLIFDLSKLKRCKLNYFYVNFPNRYMLRYEIIGIEEQYLTEKVKIELLFHRFWNCLILSEWKCLHYKLQSPDVTFDFHLLYIDQEHCILYDLGWEAQICKFGIRIGERGSDTAMAATPFVLPRQVTGWVSPIAGNWSSENVNAEEYHHRLNIFLVHVV